MIWNTFPRFLMYHPLFFENNYVKMLERKKKFFFLKVGSIRIRTPDIHVTGKVSKIIIEFAVRDSTQETTETQFQICPKMERS